MKKIIMVVSLLIIIQSCKKDPETVSQVVTASYPTITVTGSQFYSIKVGDPIPEIQAAAYDSIIQESYTAELDASGIDNQTPGLYIVPIRAVNRYGYIGSMNVYIAVTNIAEAIDLSGTYARAATGGEANISEQANGLYETDNVGGNAGASTHAYFVQVSETECILPDQPTSDGEMVFTDQRFVFDTAGVLSSYEYKIVLSGYGTALRTFERQ